VDLFVILYLKTVAVITFAIFLSGRDTEAMKITWRLILGSS